MGGRLSDLDRDVLARVLVAFDAPDRAAELGEALGAAGFDVSFAEGLAAVAAASPAGESFVVLVDDAGDDWLRAVSNLIREHPRARPLALVEVEGPDQFLAALSAGVAGFVPPDAPVDAIVRTVRSLTEDGVAIPRGMVPTLVAEVRHGRGHSVQTAAGRISVTDREWEILQLLVQRRSTREMAEALYVSVGTVRSHISTLLRKLGAVDRADAIRMIERGTRS